MMISKIVRFNIRKLHTIVSRELIKPSSPTPSYSKTYNLSLLDQLAVNAYVPVVAFYQRSSVYQNSIDKTRALRHSLSKTLTRYYPFAGRMKRMSPTYVDCNDEGVEFIEAACSDTSLVDFLQHSEHKDLDQLFPDDLVWQNSNNKGCIDENSIASPLKVQVNHFKCGGIGLATSLSHKIGDASSVFNFINDWATISRGDRRHEASPIDPHFIRNSTRNAKLPEIPDRGNSNCVTKSFLFPNSKIHALKAEVTAMTTASGRAIINTTRVEVLTWLIHKCAVSAATKTNSGSFKETGVYHLMNMRNYLREKVHETTVGNFILPIEIPTSSLSDLDPNITIGEFRKRKMGFQNITSLETMTGIFSKLGSSEASKRVDKYYIYSSVCRFPAYGIDFGWGKPIKVTFSGPTKNSVIFMNTPNDDGIEALVRLDIQEMKMFQNDPELLAFC